MKRRILQDLSTWLNQSRRKPLVLRGARQVGKTWLVHELARKNKRDLIELNFERFPAFANFFEENDPRKILLLLGSYLNKEINIDQSLLFLDEIQVAPEILAKLRWFAEDMPELPVIAAGSLLDFTLENYPYSMPVGRINYAYVEPMSFEEFLLAQGQTKLYEFLNQFQLSDTIVEPVHNKLLSLLREYFFIGGMPEAVRNWVEHRSINKIEIVHHDLLRSLRDDFNKYAKHSAHESLESILNSVPKQLSRKFQYSRINADIPSSTLKKSLELLCLARVCHKIQNTDASGLPLAAGVKDRIFKVIFLDIGLVSSLLDLSLHAKILDDELHLKNEGGLAEQFIGQTLRTIEPYYKDPRLFYWVREKKTSAAEVDFIIQQGNLIIPVEVKAGSTGTLRSLHMLMGLKQLPFAFRFNSDRPSTFRVNLQTSLGQTADYNLISLPLYLTGQIFQGKIFDQ